MTLTLPLWGWFVAAIMTIMAGLTAYACGAANGTDEGVDWMKREAIRVGLAKACDFDGGWRWYTPQEIAARFRNVPATPNV